MPELTLLDGRPPTGGVLADALDTVASTLETSEASRACARRITAFAARHADALHRSCLSGHLTGSALVVDAARERVLVMLHAKLGMWLQPGGHADGEGNLASVALREAEEETGIAGLRIAVPPVDCDVHEIPARPGEPAHLHLDVRFVVLAPAGAVAERNHESHELRWVTLEELDQLATDDSLRRLAASGLAAARRL